MNNSNDTETFHIGIRMAEMRNALSSKTGINWTQGKLAKEIGVSQNIIARLEKYGLGAIDKLVKILLFFHNHGFNILWVIVPDNSNISMYRKLENDSTENQAIYDPQILESLEKLNQIKTILGN